MRICICIYDDDRAFDFDDAGTTLAAASICAGLAPATIRQDKEEEDDGGGEGVGAEGRGGDVEEGSCGGGMGGAECGKGRGAPE